MPYEVERIPGEPIIIVRLIGKVTPELMRETFDEVAKFAEEVGGEVWRISDYRQSTSTFGDTLKVAMDANKNKTGSIFDGRIKLAFVGPNQWVGLMRNMLQQPQFGSMQIPTFEEVDHALAYIRREITKSTAERASVSDEDSAADDTNSGDEPTNSDAKDTKDTKIKR